MEGTAPHEVRTALHTLYVQAMVTAIAFGLVEKLSTNPPLRRCHKALPHLGRIAAMVVEDMAIRPIAVAAIADI